MTVYLIGQKIMPEMQLAIILCYQKMVSQQDNQASFGAIVVAYQRKLLKKRM